VSCDKKHTTNVDSPKLPVTVENRLIAACPGENDEKYIIIVAALFILNFLESL